MDVRTAVAASMLPASRSAIAAAFKHAWLTTPDRAANAVLAHVLRAVHVTPSEATVSAALDAADRALGAGCSSGFQPLALGAPGYPALLTCVPDPPPVLWTWGD